MRIECEGVVQWRRDNVAKCDTVLSYYAVLFYKLRFLVYNSVNIRISIKFLQFVKVGISITLT